MFNLQKKINTIPVLQKRPKFSTICVTPTSCVGELAVGKFSMSAVLQNSNASSFHSHTIFLPLVNLSTYMISVQSTCSTLCICSYSWSHCKFLPQHEGNKQREIHGSVSHLSETLYGNWRRWSGRLVWRRHADCKWWRCWLDSLTQLSRHLPSIHALSPLQSSVSAIVLSLS